MTNPGSKFLIKKSARWNKAPLSCCTAHLGHGAFEFPASPFFAEVPVKCLHLENYSETMSNFNACPTCLPRQSILEH